MQKLQANLKNFEEQEGAEPKDTHAIAQAWVNKAKLRLQKIRTGEVKPVPWEEVDERLEQILQDDTDETVVAPT